MSPLDDLLSSFALHGRARSRFDLREPWGVRFPDDPDGLWIHVVELGQGYLIGPKGSSHVIAKGDVIVTTPGAGVSLVDIHGSYPEPLSMTAPMRRERLGGEGGQTILVSGQVRCDRALTHPLWRTLPPFFVVKAHDGQPPEGLDVTLSVLAAEAGAGHPASESILDRMFEVIFLQILRHSHLVSDSSLGWLAAVRDPSLSPALQAIYRHPEQDWSVAKLAASASMSRSSFADRFRRVVGESPMDHVARWRMHRAARLLLETANPLTRIANDVGYDSEAAFSKAFKRIAGQSPGTYRKLAPHLGDNGAHG